jgi:hypothetical protein
LAIGTFDEKFLVGERNAEGKAMGAFGVALANPEGEHFYVRNEIKGVTDEIFLSGTKFWKGSKEGSMTQQGCVGH